MRYILIVFIIFLFSGCSSKKVELVEKECVQKEVPKIIQIKPLEKICVKEKTNIPIYDLKNIPQNVDIFTTNIDENDIFYDIQKKYNINYFSAWSINKPTKSVEDVKWPFVSYRFGKSYGENLQLHSKSFFDKMLKEANFKDYATINKKAITLKYLNIRAFPTLKPLLLDPTKAGEGFPFDYLQNSSILANKPVFISHYSLDRRWVYIFSSFASGWVQSDEIVVLKKEYIDKWKKSKQIYITKEGVPIYDTDARFLYVSKIGMSFALIDEDSKNYIVLSVSKDAKNNPFFKKSKISKEISSSSILNLNKKNLANIINEVSKSKYGWGGMYEQRDCSSTLRDMFAPFGIWLPRNSYQQSKVGEVISLENLTNDEKVALIKEKAIPFKTLLYKKGHIVLYLGIYNDEIIIFHNTWGIKTMIDGVEGRIVIGKSIFSSLKLGENQAGYDKNSEILKNLKSINILIN